MAVAMGSSTGWALATASVATHQKGDFTSCHAGHATGDGRIDETDVTRLAHSAKLLRHRVRHCAGFDDELWHRVPAQ